MGLSFRKSVQILPGVKLNISKSGVSVSAGVSGLHASINTKGQVRGTASIPGTGLRYTKSVKLEDLIGGKGKDSKDNKGSKETKSDKDKSKAEKQAPKEIADKSDDITKTSKAKRNELAQSIIDIYAVADKRIDWLTIKNSSVNIGYENWDYLKSVAPKILDGDLDCYLQLIADVNPFDELIAMGSEFSCGTDSPMKMAVECRVNAKKVLGESIDNKELLEDYVAGTAIKSARDIFAILPVWQVEVTCIDDNQTLLNVKFVRDSFEELNFAKIDASDTVKKLGGIIGV